MRIWTIHPSYLDAKGLVALWRESLLAQKVLSGETRGYKKHPQLNRFKEQVEPVGAIAKYLRTILHEAIGRGYKFDASKVATRDFEGRIDCTRGQLLYEWNHLKRKLASRDIRKFAEIDSIEFPTANPIFRIVDGDVESWEVLS